ncbi:MAG: 4-(cytidine 5'-diphospho)-2-C-methyl-D-erythritol kinase [Pseudomonadota bacterium]
MIEEIAHAKINLALHVTDQRSDGFHELDSLIVFTLDGDRIFVEPNETSNNHELFIDGPFAHQLASDEENLVMRAAHLLGQTTSEVAPASIHLIKNLPVASGIGGGSADAAATLRALKQFWKLDVDLHPIAKSLGADVPMCLHSNPLRARGIGDELVLFEDAGSFPILLVNPGCSISTPSVFTELQTKQNAPISRLGENPFSNIFAISQLRNDLETPAISLNPEVGETLQALAKTDPLLCRMSGSGATCFGIYDTLKSAEDAANVISKKNPDWWIMASSTTTSIQRSL